MKILVTGGAGFIASHVVDAYVAAGHEVLVVDDLSAGKTANVNEKAHFVQGSIDDFSFLETVLADFQPEVVNHHAAQVSVIVSLQDPRTDAERNILGTINLLLAVQRTPSVTKFIYASSGGAMYGSPKSLPCLEESAALPESPYGLSKYVAERYVWLLTANNPVQATVLRYGNVYGPRQDPSGEAGVCAIFAGRMVENKPVTIFGDGSQVRDYIFVKDLAEANLLVLEKGENQSYNLGTGIGTSTLQVYEALAEAAQYTQPVTYAAARVGEVQAIILDVHKAERELGWKAKTSFKEGIAQTVAWYRTV